MNPRILLAAPSSGSGKTMISIGIMAALKSMGQQVTGYKCGPDYIDPMFHQKALGIPSSNLDPYFSSDDGLRAKVAKATGVAIIEGVMGYYDGIGIEGKCSTYDVAVATDTPVIIIVNPKGMYTSVAALLSGFVNYKMDSHIVGVIFNKTSPMMYKGLSDIAKSVGLTPLGYIPADENIAVESRHLGLLTADEISDIDVRIKTLSSCIKDTVDLETILKIAGNASSLEGEEYSNKKRPSGRSLDITIAVARDRAFSFIYNQNIRALEDAGFRCAYFSPLIDKALPEGSAALYIPGGYPELYLDELSNNTSMKTAIKKAIESGMPTIAECGGYMYLGNSIDGSSMVGVIDMESYKTDKLQRFGYGELVSDTDTLIAKAGERLRVHEFHYYDSSRLGESYIFEKASNSNIYKIGYGNDRLYAGYPHLYFDENNIAMNLYSKAREYESKNAKI